MKQPKTLPIKSAAPIGIGFGELLGKKTYQPRNPLRAGEKTIKQWKLEMAEKLGVRRHCIEHRLSRGTLKYPACRRINSRVVIILPNEKVEARAGEQK